MVGNRIEAEDPHLTGIRGAVALHGLDRRGLAGAVRAQEGEHLALGDMERELVDGDDVAVADDQLVGGDGDRHGSHVTAR